VRALLRLGGAHLPRLGTLSFDGSVLAFVAAVVIVTGVLVGVHRRCAWPTPTFRC
jgi:hypothetical protein